jgi:hypothetical protein
VHLRPPTARTARGSGPPALIVLVTAAACDATPYLPL